MLELEGQIKMEEICFSRFLKMGKDSAVLIELGRTFLLCVIIGKIKNTVHCKKIKYNNTKVFFLMLFTLFQQFLLI